MVRSCLNIEMVRIQNNSSSIDPAQLKDVHIKFISNHTKLARTFSDFQNNENAFAELDLTFGQDRCDVQFQGVNVAIMQTKAQYALQELIEASEGIRYAALASHAALAENLDVTAHWLSTKEIKQAGLMSSMNIQIFGIRSVADTVAKKLSKYHLFLQHPEPPPADIAYENPQYLNALGSKSDNWAILPQLISVPAEQAKDTPAIVSDERGLTLDGVRALVDNLPETDYLQDVELDARIKTELLMQVQERFRFHISWRTANYYFPATKRKLSIL